MEFLHHAIILRTGRNNKLFGKVISVFSTVGKVFVEEMEVAGITNPPSTQIPP